MYLHKIFVTMYSIPYTRDEIDINTNLVANSPKLQSFIHDFTNFLLTKIFCHIFLAFILYFFLSLFSSGGGKGPQIAILHPRQLSVYSITKSPGKNKKSLDNFQITLIYAHKLSRSAFSMWSVGLLSLYFGGKLVKLLADIEHGNYCIL